MEVGFRVLNIHDVINLHDIDGLSGNTLPFFGQWQGREEVWNIRTRSDKGEGGSRTADFLTTSFLNGHIGEW